MTNPGRPALTADAILAILSETPGEWVPGFRIGTTLYTRGKDVRIETRRRVLRDLTNAGRIETRTIVGRGTRLEHRVLRPAFPQPAPAMPAIETPARPQAPERPSAVRFGVIRWQAPPPPRSEHRIGPYASHSRFDELAEELRARRDYASAEDSWAVVYEGSRNTAMGLSSGINRATTKCFQPRGSFQATARSEYGTHVVYARFVG